MSDAKKQTSLMATLAVCAVFVALISFFLPFVTINFIGEHSYSAIDCFEEIMDDPEFPDLGLLISMGCTVLGVFSALFALKERGMEVGTIVTSVAGLIFMLIAMSSDIGFGLKAIDYAGSGFYLYVMASFSAIILSISARYMSPNADSSDAGKIPTPVPEPLPKPKPPAPAPIPVKKVVCTKCNAEQDKNAAFCRYCGTPINNNKIVSLEPVPTPDPVPTPEHVSKIKEGKVMCPHCGARHVKGTPSCKYCGTAITDVQNTSSAKPIHVGKSERKAICPHCGARQSEDAITCKYCGTAMK